MNGHLAVVGAGINGLCFAYRLQSLGHDVTIFDCGPIPHPAAASHGMHRLIHPWTASDCPETAIRAQRALELWQDLLQDIACDGFEQTGVLALRPPAAGFFDRLGIRHERLFEPDITCLCPFFGGTEADEATFFPDYGVLYAERILHALVEYLAAKGVTFRPGKAVTAVDAARGQLTFNDASRMQFDHVILAAGTGSGTILSRSRGVAEAAPSFEPRRCYVAYVDLSSAQQLTQQRVPWASLGEGDLWGMPLLGDLPMKLGCGAFTRPCAPDVPEDAMRPALRILRTYAERFPALVGAGLLRGAYGHWTAIDTSGIAWRQDRLTTLTSDNGAGFKFAPLAVRDALAPNTAEVEQTRHSKEGKAWASPKP